jgi:hypothetical protein
MKTSRILKLLGVVLIVLSLSFSVEANDRTNRHVTKKAVTLTIDKPIIEFLAKSFGDQVDAKDIVRMQKMLSQIDHITITFRDADAADYILNFKSLDKQGLEDWMFSEGYLTNDSDLASSEIEPWMLDPEYLE